MIPRATAATLEKRLDTLRHQLDELNHEEALITEAKRDILDSILSTRRRIHRLNQGAD